MKKYKYVDLSYEERADLISKVQPGSSFFISLESILPLEYTVMNSRRLTYIITDEKKWLLAKLKYGFSVNEYEGYKE